MEKHILISTTTNTISSARNIASTLVKEKKAACVQIATDIEPHYNWENELKVDSEFLLYIKTSTSNKDDVIKILKDLHPYSTPEVISHEIKILNDNYRKWFNLSMKANND